MPGIIDYLSARLTFLPTLKKLRKVNPSLREMRVVDDFSLKEMKSLSRIQILDEVFSLYFHVNVLLKSMNQIFFASLWNG